MSDSQAIFGTTQWQLVLHSGSPEDSAAGRALAELCGSYWPPLYAFVRRRGFSAADAEDAVQGFFLHLIESKTFARADPARGRFRSFLLGAFTRFLSRERERESALKRGGGHELVSFDAEVLEQRGLPELTTAASPERAFEERWALTVVERALAGLEREARTAGKAEAFAALRSFLTGERDAESYPEMAAALQTNVQALRTMVHRLRREFGSRLRREITQTLDDPAAIEDELRHLRETLGAVL